MAKLIGNISKKSGLIPGTLVKVGDKTSEKTNIRIIDYNENGYNEKVTENVEECFDLKNNKNVTWINIDGLDNIDIIEKIGENYQLHPLMLEDILNTEQRPKLDDFEEYIFIVIKMLYFDKEGQAIIAEQVSLIIGKKFVISFQEIPGDVFENIRDRIRNTKGRIRKMDADYLGYSLLDAIVDNYFVILEKIGDTISELEDDLINNPDTKILKEIHKLKRDMIFLRKSIWPLRSVISNMLRNDNKLIDKKTLIFLRDLYDHTIQVIDTIESLRDILTGMLDIYLSSISFKMNSIMKVLTIIATIFIPLTFIAGLYGMNFKNIPEIKWDYGYYYSLALMGGIGIIMIIYFKIKKWF